MKQALAALFGAAFTVAACYAVGAVLLEKLRVRPLRRGEQIPLAFVLGAACLHVLMFVLFASHLAYRPVLVGLCGAAGLAGCLRPLFRPRQPARPAAPRRLESLVPLIGGAPFFLLYFINAWAPEASPDGSG